MREYEIIGAASCWGAQIRACERGPEELLEGGLPDILKQMGMIIPSWEILFPKEKAWKKNIPLTEIFPVICEFNHLLGVTVREVIERGRFPIVIGGDHGNAVGTWNGVRRGLQKHSPQPLGLIWIDAHMDSHTPETSPSGAWHGMPLATLLGKGKKEWVELFGEKFTLLPEHVCIVGVRSFEDEEAKLLEHLKVRVFKMEEVKSRGLEKVFDEALAIVQNGTCGFGISIDLDVLDPKEAPGVGSPEPGGLHQAELVRALFRWNNHPSLKALEIVEYNPERDVEKKTAKIVPEIIGALCIPKIL